MTNYEADDSYGSSSKTTRHSSLEYNYRPL